MLLKVGVYMLNCKNTATENYPRMNIINGQVPLIFKNVCGVFHSEDRKLSHDFVSSNQAWNYLMKQTFTEHLLQGNNKNEAREVPCSPPPEGGTQT